MRLTLLEVASNHGGICGEGFDVVTFTDHDRGADLVAVVFPYRKNMPCCVAVFDRAMIGRGVIGTGNSWRGDHYAAWLDAVIKIDELSFWILRGDLPKYRPYSAYRLGRRLGTLASTVLSCHREQNTADSHGVPSIDGNEHTTPSA